MPPRWVEPAAVEAALDGDGAAPAQHSVAQQLGHVHWNRCG
jgi:hypothetical protein